MSVPRSKGGLENCECEKASVFLCERGALERERWRKGEREGGEGGEGRRELGVMEDWAPFCED